MKHLIRNLWKYFIAACIPFAVLLAIGWVIHRDNPASILPEGALRPVGISVFLGAVILNVALPILFRVRFHNTTVANPPLTVENYLAHQRRQANIIGLGAVVAGAAYVMVLPNLFLYGSVLCGLYGLYSIFPSDRKSAGELKAYGCELSAGE